MSAVTRAPRTSREGLGEHGATILVAGLASAFGVVLLQLTANLSLSLGTAGPTAGSDTAALMLVLTSVAFLAIAVYVGAVVTANTVAAIVAGRVRRIALLRLLGSTARSQRLRLAREALVAGLLGAAAGAAAALGIVRAATALAVSADLLPALDYPFVSAASLWPVPLVVLSTFWAAWIGSRRVLTVAPLEALGASGERRPDELWKPGRAIASALLTGLGLLLLLLGIGLGLVSPLGVLIGVIGGMLSFTGVVLGGAIILPPALRLVGRLFGRSAPAVQAAANALRNPERSSRSTIGLVIGVTLITMFSVAMSTFGDLVIASARIHAPELIAEMEQLVSAVTAVFAGLVGISAVIAAVGLVNSLSVAVLQRQRELGLLRTLGFTVRQVRWMIVAEAAQLTLSALVIGFPLGIFYGWAGAQSLLASSAGGMVVPSMPWLVILGIVAAAAVLVAVSSLAPARRATRVSPVEALAIA